MVQTVASTVIALGLIAAYVAVTVSGMDGNPILGALTGYLGGAGVHAAIRNGSAKP